MAVADAVIPSTPPPPPPSRIILSPMLALARATADARPYLCSAIAWIISASSAAAVVARRVWSEGSAPLVFVEALTDGALRAGLCIIFLIFAHMALLLCDHDLLFLPEILCDLVFDFRKSDIGKIILEGLQDLNMSTRTVLLGVVAYVSCILLILTGCLVATMSPPVEGSMSQGEKIGSMILDVGLSGIHAIHCVVFIPAFAPRPSARREDPSDRQRSLLRQS